MSIIAHGHRGNLIRKPPMWFPRRGAVLPKYQSYWNGLRYGAAFITGGGSFGAGPLGGGNSEPDLVDGNVIWTPVQETVSDVRWATTEYGPAMRFDDSFSGTGTASSVKTQNRAGTDILLEFAADTPATIVVYAKFFASDGDVSNPGMTRNSQGSQTYMVRNHSTGNYTAKFAGGPTHTNVGALTAGEWSMCSLQWGGGRNKAWVHQRGAVIGSNDAADASYTVSRIGYWGKNVEEPLNGSIGAIYIWGRMLSPIELGRLSLDPYCFIRPKQTYVPFTAAAVDVGIDTWSPPVNRIVPRKRETVPY